MHKKVEIDIIGFFIFVAVFLGFQTSLSQFQSSFQDANSFPPVYLQPFCSEFTRWSQNPAQYQLDNENGHGLGLIPSPVDISLMPSENTIPLHQSKFIFQKSQNRLMSIFNKNIKYPINLQYRPV